MWNLASRLIDESQMINQWKNKLILLSKSRNTFFTSHDTSDKAFFEFLNQYLLQLIVLWIFQKRGYFNNDKNYFLNMFQSIKNKESYIPFKTFSEFINSLLTRLKTLNDHHICRDSQFGKLRGCKSAVFLNIEQLNTYAFFPNSHFYSEIDPRSPNEVNSEPSGILNILETIEFEINGPFLGSVYEWLMSSKKKRRSGVYYSPEDLTSYICRYSLRSRLMDKMGSNSAYSPHSWMEFIESLEETGLLKLFEKLKDLTILDPAVGTGQFLESAVDELLSIYNLIVRKSKELPEPLVLNLTVIMSQNKRQVIDLSKITSLNELEFYLMYFIIFPKTLYGVDIDPLVIPFTKARFFVYVTRKLKNHELQEKKVNDFECNLNPGDSLLLNWERSFTNSLQGPKLFSLVLTNPPYIGESDNKDLFRKYAEIHPNYYEGKIDIWYLFLHLAITLAQPGGIVSFLATNYWLTASGASKLRERLSEETFIMEFIDFGDNRLFEGVHGIHSSILTIKKLAKSNPAINCIFFAKRISLKKNLMDVLSQQSSFQIDQKDLTLNNWDDYFHFIPPEVSLLMKSITENCLSIRNSSFIVNEGLITGLNKITNRQIEKYSYPPTWVNRGIFVFDLDNFIDQDTINGFTSVEKEYLRPLYKSSSIKHYSTQVQTSHRVLYLVRNNTDFTTIPNIKKHLDLYQIATRNSLDHPPYLNRPRKKEIFLSPKLVTPQRAQRTHFAYNPTEWFAAQDVYFIRDRGNSVINLKVLLLLLQSKLSFYWFSWMGKKKGRQLEFFGESVSNFPIPKKLTNPNLLARIADYLIFLNSLENISKDFQQIQTFFEEKIANIIVYKNYLHSQFLTTPDQNQLFNDVCEFLLLSLQSIDVDRFLNLRYSIFSSKKAVMRDEIKFQDLLNSILVKIKASYQIILSDKRITKLNNQADINQYTGQVDDFFSSK
ncbi:MAG: Eco57I restriction-modification methylase domain-containing protein [Candidatus Hodarchaeales archaeon]